MDMKNLKVEAEGGELVLTNGESYAIVSKNKRSEVLEYLREGCQDCINSFVSSLPKNSDYAEDGTLIVSQPPPIDYELMSKVLTQRNSNLNWVARGINPESYPKIANEDGSFSTHRLSYATFDNGEAVIYPTIIQNEQGMLEELDEDEAYEYAMRTKTFLTVPDEKLAEYYSQNGLIKH